jgi:hypothetical protein
VLPQTARLAEVAVTAEPVADREEAEDRSGRAADHIERQGIDLVPELRADEPQRFRLQGWIVEQVRRVEERQGDPDPAAVERVPVPLRDLAGAREGLPESAARGVRDHSVRTEVVQPGQEEGDAAGAGVELGAEGLVRDLPFAGVRFHRVAEPVAAPVVPDRVAAEERADRPGRVEEPFARGGHGVEKGVHAAAS